MLRARGLSLGYGDSTILSAVDWTVHEGERWFLIGTNGSGKSTLLRGIFGALPPLEGSLELGPLFAERRHIGYVPQRCDLNRSLPTTVEEFVALGLVGVPTRRAERGARVQEALVRVGLAEHQRSSYWSLSGGQRQRALLARALVRRPAVLVLDEPTEGLDVATQEVLLEALDALHAETRLTEIVVTHRLDIARERASHVAFFQAGRVKSGPRDEVLESIRRSGTFAKVELASS